MAEDNKVQLVIEAKPDTASAKKAGDEIGTNAGGSAAKSFEKAFGDLKISSSRKKIVEALNQTALSSSQAEIAARNPALAKWTEKERELITTLQQQKKEYEAIVKLLKEKDKFTAQKNLTKYRADQNVRAAEERAQIQLRTEAAKISMREQARQIREASKATKEMGGIMHKVTGIFEKFGRVLVWRLYRMAAMKLLQSLSEGFKMFVDWDREQNNSMAGVAKNVDKLNASWMTLKGSIGALGGALANTFLPIITKIIDALTKMVDIIQMVIRSLQGEKTYYKMIYHEAAATTGAAKELKRVLFGFDDLNVLNSPGGGGGTSGTGSWDYDLLPINSKFLNGIADISNKIKEFLGLTEEGQNIIGGLVGVVGALIGAKALGGLLGLLPRLISGIGGKSNALKNETAQTAADATATEGLATKLGLALGAASLFATFLKKNPLQVNIPKPQVDFSGAERQIAEEQRKFSVNPVTVPTAVSTLVPALTNAYNVAKTWIGSKTLTVPTAVQEIASKVKSAFNIASAWLKNPLVFTTTLVLSATGGTLLTQLSNIISAMNQYARSNPVVIDIYQQIHTSTVSTPSSSVASKGVQGVSSRLSSGKPATSTSSGIYNPLLYINQNYNSLKSLSAMSNLKIPDPIYNEIYWVADYNRLDNIKKWLSGLKHINVPMNPAYGSDTQSFLSTLMLQLQQIAGMGFGLYASGGSIPNTGSLILAGEAGPEIVANMGSSTGVMNVQQMEAAVANGNIDVVNAVYAMANMVSRAIGEKDFDVYLDTAKVGRSVTNYQNNQARRGITQGAY